MARRHPGFDRVTRDTARALPAGAPEAALTGLEIRQLVYKSHRVLFIVSGREAHVLHVRHGARLPLGHPDAE